MMAALRRLPLATVSRLVGRVADVPVPRAVRPAVHGLFARSVGADLGEVELPLTDYRTLDAFFTRRLRDGTRTMPEDPDIVVSPVDGRVTAVGDVTVDGTLEVKGQPWTSEQLLDDPGEAGRYDGGSFVILYLSPRDYHRIHAPYEGRLDWARHAPGRLLPVNPPAVTVEPDLFVRNERISCAMDTRAGRMAVVAVGALDVGRISTAFDPGWNGPRGGVSNRPRGNATTRRYEPPLEIVRGDELMTFHLGSSVVVLLERGAVELVPDLEPGDRVRLGQPLGAASGTNRSR
jgi:phosphatidylserine decarboxylase